LAWTIEYSATAEKQLRKLDNQVARRIVTFMRERVANADDPRERGTALVGLPHWRYRVGDYRVICEIEDNRMRILFVRIGNRRDVYR
jgi:mRNA interferase RelE/StbE